MTCIICVRWCRDAHLHLMHVYHYYQNAQWLQSTSGQVLCLGTCYLANGLIAQGCETPWCRCISLQCPSPARHSCHTPTLMLHRLVCHSTWFQLAYFASIAGLLCLLVDMELASHASVMSVPMNALGCRCNMGKPFSYICILFMHGVLVASHLVVNLQMLQYRCSGGVGQAGFLCWVQPQPAEQHQQLSGNLLLPVLTACSFHDYIADSSHAWHVLRGRHSRLQRLTIAACLNFRNWQGIVAVCTLINCNSNNCMHPTHSCPQF